MRTCMQCVNACMHVCISLSLYLYYIIYIYILTLGETESSCTVGVEGEEEAAGAEEEEEEEEEERLPFHIRCPPFVAKSLLPSKEGGRMMSALMASLPAYAYVRVC
jgi:hypothetical protein